MNLKAFIPVAFLIGGMAVCHGAVFTVKLSPAGTSPAVGLSPSNEVPVVTNGTGSGGQIFGGITFDTNTLTLHNPACDSQHKSHAKRSLAA